MGHKEQRTCFSVKNGHFHACKTHVVEVVFAMSTKTVHGGTSNLATDPKLSEFHGHLAEIHVAKILQICSCTSDVSKMAESRRCV